MRVCHHRLQPIILEGCSVRPVVFHGESNARRRTWCGQAEGPVVTEQLAPEATERTRAPAVTLHDNMGDLQGIIITGGANCTFLVNVMSGPRLTMPGVTAWADGFRQAVSSGAGHYPGRTPLCGHRRERNEQLGQDVAETRRERQGFSVPRGFAMEEEKLLRISLDV